MCRPITLGPKPKHSSIGWYNGSVRNEIYPIKCAHRFVLPCFVVLPLKLFHDDVIKWKHFPRYWSFVRGIYRSPVDFSREGQWRGALMFSLMCVWTNAWANSRYTGDLRRHDAYHISAMTDSCDSVLTGTGGTACPWELWILMHIGVILWY